MQEATPQDIPTDELRPEDIPVVTEASPLTLIQEAVLMLFCSFTTKPDKHRIAAELGISYNRVCAIVNSKEFKAAYRDICRTMAGYRLKEVMEKNADLALQGHPKHTEMYLKMQGILYDKMIDVHKPVEKPSNNDELEARKMEIKAQLKAEMEKEQADNAKNRSKDANFVEVKNGR